MIDFSKIYQLKGLGPKNKGQTNFYESCDLTIKLYLAEARQQQPLLQLKVVEAGSALGLAMAGRENLAAMAEATVKKLLSPCCQDNVFTVEVL